MTLHTIAKTLHEQGFSVIPTNNRKQPLDSGWQHLKDEGRIEPNGNFDTGAAGVGLPCGQRVAGGYLNALDVDCYNKEVSRQLCSFIAELIGHPVPYRVGTAPKFLIPFTHNAPIRKRTSKPWNDGQRDHKGKLIESRIEVLGEGQQFVAYGEANGVPYRWFNGELDRTSLPRLTDHQLQQVTDEFYRLAEAHHMSQSDDADPFSGEAGVEDDPFISAQKPPLEDFDTDKVKSLLRAYPAEGLDYDRWVETGMALSHQYNNGPEGYGLWLKWSKPSSKFDPREMPTKWRSFKNEGRQVTLATIIKRAKARQGKEKAKQERADRGPRFRVGFGDIGDLRPISWVIRGVIERDTLTTVYGASGVGKSLAVVDMVMCTAYGVDYHGHKVKEPQKVVYMAGEGLRGLAMRMLAWCRSRDLDPALFRENVALTGDIPNFGDGDDIDDAISELKRIGFGTPAMFVIDTLARAGVGLEENSASDMGRFIGNCDKARTALGGTAVVIVHHEGKNSAAGARGSSAIRAAMDCEIHITPRDDITDGGTGLLISSTKCKDSEPFREMAFRFQRVNFGVMDDEGEEIYSMTLAIDDLSESLRRGRPRSDEHTRRVEDCIKSFRERGLQVDITDDTLASEYGLDAPSEAYDLDDIRQEFYARHPDFDAGDTKSKATAKKQFSRAVGKLKDAGKVISRDEILYVF